MLTHINANVLIWQHYAICFSFLIQ